jgi:hypothetical protein
MKNIIYLFLLLLFFKCAPPQRYHLNLIISVQSCNHRNDFFLYDLQLQKPDNIILSQKQTDSIRRVAELTGQYESQFTNLDSGQYTLQFTNFYNQKVSQIIDLQPLTTKIKICADTFVDTHELTLFEKMAHKDSLICELRMSGCFQLDEESYKFKYENGILIGTFITNKLKTIRKALTPNDLAYLIQFEKQLRLVHLMQGYCTTHNTFILHLNDKETITIEDGTCRWGGEIDMKKKIFGVSENTD